jgi:hypothetical protein
MYDSSQTSKVSLTFEVFGARFFSNQSAGRLDVEAKAEKIIRIVPGL